ncbi:hypothetical protein A1351_16040 [Methylosinus sp. R-45379]|uniref:hypothetical protein n=1 Tax=Methylosinus sp. R-45379 TaxID=980563 RepID=UPI0007C8CDBC|nr:hypothetical protein [Methylosinus sp. R-45379]OAI25721.1 hypothetical protein A1351_16040 [Methylosinus sp. R-45379]
MNHILWFMIVGTLAFLTAAYQFQTDPILKYVFVVFALVPSVVFVVTHFFFMLKSPDRLQSEEFVLRQHELIIYEKGANAEIVDPNRDIPRVELHPSGFTDGGDQ